MSSFEDCSNDKDINNQNEETKEEKMDENDEEYDRKLEEMRSYLPFLEMMIEKLRNSKKDSDFREAQMLKIQSLHRILFNSKRRMKMETLLKCEAVLRNLQEKLKEKDYLQAGEDISTRNRDIDNKDSDYRIVTLESSGNIKIDKLNEVQSEGEHRTVQLKEDGLNMTINTHFQRSEPTGIQRRMVDNERSNWIQDDKKAGYKKGMFRSSPITVSRASCRMESMEKYRKLNRIEKTTAEPISSKKDSLKVPDVIKKDKSLIDSLKTNKRQQEVDLREYLNAPDKSPYFRYSYSPWESRKDFELSRRKLQSLIEHQDPSSDSSDNNILPELSTEGLLKINYRSRYDRHRLIPETWSEKYENENPFISQSFVEASHTLNSNDQSYENENPFISQSFVEESHTLNSNDQSLPVVQNPSENRPIPGLQNCIQNESETDKNKKSLGVEDDIAQEEKLVLHGASSQVSNMNVAKHVGGRTENIKEIKPQQSLRAKLTEEISTVHKIGTACGGALRGLINKDDKSLSTSRILSLKTGTLIDLLSKNKSPSVKPTRKKLFSETHKVQENRSHDLQKQGKIVTSCSVPSFQSSVNKATTISNPNAIISNLSHEDLEKLVSENVKNLPSPPPIILESVRAKMPSLSNKDVIQNQSVPSDIVKCMPTVTDSNPFHSMCQPQNVYHVNTVNIGHQEIDGPRSVPQEMSSSSTYIIQQQGQQNIVNSNGVYTLSSVNMTMHHQPMLNPVTPLSADLQYQFSSQQQQQPHPMNIHHQHPLFVHQNMVSGHQQTQNIQQSSQVYGMSTPQIHMSASSHMHTVTAATPQIHVMPPVQSPPGILDSVPCHSLSKSGYSNQVSEGWVSKFDQDRRNLNTFQRRSENHSGRVESYKWGLHGNQSNYVDSPSVQSSHRYYNTNKQTNVHQPQPSVIGSETRVSCDQRSVTSLHRGLSARDPRRRSIEEMVGQSQSFNRSSSRSDQNRGRDPRLTSGKYNKDMNTKNRDPRIQTVTFKAKHTLPLIKSKSRTDIGDKMKDRIASSPLEKLYNTNFKEITGKGYGPQRYKIPKIKRVDETVQHNYDMKEKSTYRSEEKNTLEGKPHIDSKLCDISSRRSQKIDVKKEGERKNTSKQVSFVIRDKDRELHEDSCVGSEEKSVEEEIRMPAIKTADSSRHETKRFKLIRNRTFPSKETVENPTVLKKIENHTQSYLKKGSKDLNDSSESDKPVINVDNCKIIEQDTKGDNFEMAKSDTKNDKTVRQETKDGKTAKQETKDDKTARQETKDGKTAKQETKDGKTAKQETKDGKTTKQETKDGKTAKQETKDGKTAKQDTKDGKTTKQDTKDGKTAKQETKVGKTAKQETKDGKTAKQETKDGKTAKQETKDGKTAKQEIKDGNSAKQDTKDSKTAKQETKDGKSAKLETKDGKAVDKSKPVTENGKTAEPDREDEKKNKPNTDDKSFLPDNEDENDALDLDKKDDKTVKLSNDVKVDKPSSEEDNLEIGKLGTNSICNKSEIIETIVNKSMELDEKKKLLKKLEENLTDKKIKKILKIIENSSDEESNGDEMKIVKANSNSEAPKADNDKKSIPDVSEENRCENYKSNDETDADESMKEVHLKKFKKYNKKKPNKSERKPVNDNIDNKNLHEIECIDLGSSKIESTLSDVTDRPKRKQKNELEKLQEDIRDMFISKGVVSATGMRMCRMQRESTSSVLSNSSLTSLSGKESVLNLRSNKKESEKGVRESKSNKGTTDSLPDESSDYNTSDDELLETIHKNLKSKQETDAVGESDDKTSERIINFVNEEKRESKNNEDNTMKVPENIGSPRIILKKTDLSKLGNVSSTNVGSPVKVTSTEEFENSLPEKPVARHKICKGRKKGNWKLGIIHKKGKPKIQPNKCKVVDEAESNNAEIKRGNIVQLVDYLDIHYYQGKLKRYQCKLCTYEGKAIVHHYLVCHPGEEVLISRLSPASAADAVKGSARTGYLGTLSNLSDKFQCRMCTRNFPSVVSFYEHITMHTGEYRHECLKCGYRTSTRKGIRYHVKTSHPETRKGETHFRVVHEITAKEKVVIGYLCSGCNFVQLRECNLKKHIQEKHFNKEAKIIAINLSKHKLRADEQRESEIVEGDQTFEIKEEFVEEMKTVDEAGDTDDNYEINASDIDTKQIEEADVSARLVVNEHETELNNTSQNQDSTEGKLKLNEDDSEKDWSDVVIKKEQEINIVDIDTRNSPNFGTTMFSVCDRIQSGNGVQKELETSDSIIKSTENLKNNEGNKLNKVDQTNVFLCSEDFSRYEDNVRLERELTMQEIARSINANDIKGRKITILDQVLEKLNTRNKEYEECSGNLELVTIDEERNVNKLPVNTPSPVVVEDDSHSSDKNDNVRTRRSLPERLCKEKTSKIIEKNCHTEIDSLSDTNDLSDFKEYLRASPAESEMEIVDIREITGTVDNTDTEEVSRKNLCLQNTVSQLTETLKTSKVREFLLNQKFSDGELWFYKVKNLPHHSWRFVMNEIKHIIGSADFRNACGCTSSISLEVGPLQSYCPNECWFFKCNVQNCSFTTSVALSFAEHIECNHICTTWNGVCKLCKIIYCIDTNLSSSYCVDSNNSQSSYCVENNTRSSYHLASAFLHLLKDHFLKLNSIPVNELQKKTKDCVESGETNLKSSEKCILLDEESAHKMPQQVQVRPFAGPILRVRRLSGDKLSVTPAEKMRKSTDESKVTSNQDECKSAVSAQTEEKGCSFLRIENVVSLNPSATVKKSDNMVQTVVTVSSPPSASKPIFVTADSTPTKVQTITSPPRTVLLSTRPIYKSFKFSTNQNISKQLPVNQLLAPRLIRPNLRCVLPPNTQFVSNQLLNYKIVNMKVPQGIDIRSPGQIIYPVVSTVSPQLSPSKPSQSSVSTVTAQQIQAVIQCVQQQQQADQTQQLQADKAQQPQTDQTQQQQAEQTQQQQTDQTTQQQTDQTQQQQADLTQQQQAEQTQQQKADQTQKAGKRNVKKTLTTTGPIKPFVNLRRSSLLSQNLADLSKSILQYKDPAAYKEMVLYKNIVRFYKCMSRDCSFSSTCGKAFVSHLEKHKAEDESKGIPDDKRQWTKCVYCLKTFKAPKEFCIHVRKEHGQSDVQCAYCFYRSTAIANVVFHQKICHKTETLSLLKCAMLDKIPPRIKGLNISALVKPFLCSQGQCSFRTYLFHDFETHLKMLHKKNSFIACYICKLQTIGISQLLRHFKEEHHYNEFQCLHCMFGTETENAIRYHLYTVHADYEPAAVARVKAFSESECDSAEQLKKVIFIEEIDKKYIRSPPPPLQDIVPGMPLLCTKRTLTPQKSVTGKNDIPIDGNSLGSNDRVTAVNASKKKNGNGKVHKKDPLSVGTDTVSRTKETTFINNMPDELLNVSNAIINAGSDESSIEIDTLDDSYNETTEKSSTDKNSESITTGESSSNTDSPSVNNTDLLKRTMTRTKNYITGLRGMDLYRCAYEGCRYKGNDSAELKSHLQTCERAQYASHLKCAHCPKMLKNSANLMEHLRTHGPLRYMCSLCDFKDSVQSRITTHMKHVHKVSSTYPVPVNIFGKNSEHAQFVLVPKEKGVQKLLVQKKKRNSKSKQTFSPDEINEVPLSSVFPKPLRCSLCKYASKVRTNLLIHLNLHLESAAKECNVPDAEVVNPVPCLDKNEMMFDKMMNLASSSHKNIPKVDKTETKKEEVEDAHLPQFVPRNQRYSCSCVDCTYRTITESMLRYHIRSLHNNQSHYRCPHCPESSTASLVSVDRIAAHMKLHDTQLYKCSHCSYHHYTRHVVERHVTEKHPEKRPFVIAVRERDPEVESSSETDTREGGIASGHLMTEGGVKTGSKQIHCKLCKFRAGNEEDMKTHCGNVHGIKSQFKCGLCAFTSDDDSDFDAHFAESHDKLPTQIVSLYEKVKKIPVIPLSSDALCEASTSAALIGDSTPLWQRGGNRVRHIRGIFIDEEGTAQAPIATPTLEQITNQMDPEIERFPPHGHPAAGSYYVCPVCTKYKTKDPAAMKTHLYREQNYKPWLCTVCGITTQSRIQLLKHLSKHHSRETKESPDSFVMYCQESDCEKWVDGVLETQLNLMVTENDSTDVQSGDDTRKLLKAKSPSNRKRRAVTENVASNGEGKSKPTKAKRQKTVSKLKELEASITKGRYCCGYCTLSTDHKAILKLHHQKMHSSFQESSSNNEETSNNDDVEIIEPRDPLEVTSSYLDSGDQLSTQISVQSKSKGRKNKFTKCAYCNFIAHTLTMVKNHWRSDHKFRQYSKSDDLLPNTGVKFLYKTIFFDSDETYECRWCKFTGKLPDIQEHHQLLHPGLQFHVILINVPNYKCSVCNAVYTSVNDITKHFTEAHGKEVSLIVPDKKQDTALPLEKMYRCPLCMATYYTLSYATSHLQVHSVIHKCFYCDEDFMDLTDGQAHMASKHFGLEPQFHVVKLSDKDLQIMKESISIVYQNESDLIKAQNAKKITFTGGELDKHSGQKRSSLFSSDIARPKKIKQTARKSTTPYQKRYVQSTTFWPAVAGSNKSDTVDCGEEYIIPDVDTSREPPSDRPYNLELSQKSNTQDPLVTIELSDSDENLP